MHRSITASVPAKATRELVDKLKPIEHVLSVSVSEGDSIKPPGDVITVHLLNKGADDVLQALAAAGKHGEITVVTGLADSISNPGRQHDIDKDVDEGIWEEMESGLVHHGRLTKNYFLLMTLGGIIAGAGIAREPVHAAAAVISASVIAPGYEPVAKIALAVVLRRWPILRHALLSVAVGYMALIFAAALTLGLLARIGEVPADAIATNEFVRGIVDPSPGMLIISAAGALAGAIMITSFREAVLAGPLITLALIPTAAVVGAGLVSQNFALAVGGLKRLFFDVSCVIVLGALVFGVKRLTVHPRDPIV